MSTYLIIFCVNLESSICWYFCLCGTDCNIYSIQHESWIKIQFSLFLWQKKLKLRELCLLFLHYYEIWWYTVQKLPLFVFCNVNFFKLMCAQKCYFAKWCIFKNIFTSLRCYVSQITDADLLWYKDEWKKQTFIFNGFWDIHVQTWVSVRKTLACEWLKGAFFRNIYLRKYLVKEAKIWQQSLYLFKLWTIVFMQMMEQDLRWSDCLEVAWSPTFTLWVFSKLWGENIFHFLICVIFISETS